MTRYTATLRCRTWHSWPEKTLFGSTGLRVTFAGGHEAVVGVAVATYLARSIANDYRPEGANLGPLVWTGQVPGLYMLNDTILKAPEDTIEITCEHEAPRRGEVDILVAVDIADELPPGAPDALKSIAFSFQSLLNLRLHDFLMPSAPVQISQRLEAG